MNKYVALRKAFTKPYIQLSIELFNVLYNGNNGSQPRNKERKKGTSLLLTLVRSSTCISKCLIAAGNLMLNSLEIGLSGKWSSRRRAHLLAPLGCSLKPNQSMWKTNTRLKRTRLCAAVLLPSSPNWIWRRNILVFWTNSRFA